MQYTITAPSHLQHTAKLPASKSISNRALIIHALSGGKMLPENLSNCDDTEVIVAAMRDNPYEINIKAAGTAIWLTRCVSWEPISNTLEKRDFPHSASKADSWKADCWKCQATSVRNISQPC